MNASLNGLTLRELAAAGLLIAWLALLGEPCTRSCVPLDTSTRGNRLFSPKAP